LGTLTHAVSVSDNVNTGNTVDTYQIVHPGGRFIASLTNTTQSVQLELAADVNHDGQINTNAGSNEIVSNPIAAAPSIDINNLVAGTYFISVVRQTADTNYTLNVSPSADFGGSNFATARDVGAPINTVFSDSIRQGSDSSDFFKLDLEQTRQVTMQLSGLSQDAGFRVFRDVVNPNTIDLGEQLFTVDLNNTAAAGETRSVALSAGTYFVEVFAKSATTTAYNFSIATNPTGIPDDAGGQSTDQPVGLGSLDTAPHGFSDFVGGADNADFYGFSLNNTSTLHAELRGLTADADLQIIKLVANGIGFSEQVVLSAPFGGTSDEVFDGSLLPGNYFAKVFSKNVGDTNYLLKLQITQVDGAGESSGAARDIGILPRSSAVRTFNDRIGGVDTDDFYKFTLDDFRDLRVRLTGLDPAIQADADLSIVDSNGTTVLSNSSHAGSANETAHKLLLPGTYFVRVKSILGESNYTVRFDSTQGTDLPGETLATARNVGNINSAQVKNFIHGEFVGGSDTKDIFKFKTTKGLEILTPHVPNGVQVQFIQDKDNDGVVDSNEVLTPSSAILKLLPGTYFSRVRIASGASVSNAVYDLNVDFREIDTVGNSRASAFDLGDSPNRTFNGFYVGSDDTSDVYKFSLFGVAPFLNIKAKLSGLSANADLFLLDQNGNELAHSSHGGTTQETINFSPLIGGTFFLKVGRVSGNTLYNLSIDA
ncbi:MAG TPA: PPC domain-containing protein, partial [Tepidisphaeraceae bacterium]